MTPPARAPLGTVAAMVAGFVMIGLAEGSLGIAWPAMRDSFDQPLAAIAFLLYATTAGYLLASLVLSHLALRVPTGPLLLAAPLCGAVGAATVAVAPALAVAVPGAFLLGVAGAGVDGRLNTYTSVHLGPHLLNVMHGGFGVGAFAGPLGVTALLAVGWSWRWAYGALAVFDLGLALAFAALRHRWRPLPTVHDASPLGEHTDVGLGAAVDGDAAVDGGAAMDGDAAVDGGAEVEAGAAVDGGAEVDARVGPGPAPTLASPWSWRWPASSPTPASRWPAGTGPSSC